MSETAKKQETQPAPSQSTNKLGTPPATQDPFDTYFVDIKDDKFAKSKMTWAKFTLSWERAFMPEGHHKQLTLGLYYAQVSEQDDLLVLNVNYYNRDGGYPNLGDFRLIFLLDNGETVDLHEVVHTDYKSSTQGYGDGSYVQYWEMANLRVPISDFSKIVNANGAEISIRFDGGRFDFSLTPDDLVKWKGFYNNVFDRDFKRDELKHHIQVAPPKMTTVGGSCYIATHCYGNENHPDVELFRLFRDKTLSRTKSGRIFVDIYYSMSPILLRLFHSSSLITVISRKFLAKFADKLRAKYNS